MSEKTEVLYNGSCPICSREVRQYARMSNAAGADIGFDDLAEQENLDKWGVSADDAARRFHVRRGGEIFSGLPAFIVLWRELPKMRWLARLLSIPGLHWSAVKTYDHILAPALYLSHRRRR